MESSQKQTEFGCPWHQGSLFDKLMIIFKPLVVKFLQIIKSEISFKRKFWPVFQHAMVQFEKLEPLPNRAAV